MSATTSNHPVAIVTDSAAALSTEQASKYGLLVARMEITVEDETYLDGDEELLKDFYTRLEGFKSIPTTSAPKPAEFLDRIRKAAESAENVFVVTVSAKLSASFDAAKVAAELFMNENPGRIVHVFDSRTAASSQALIAIEASRVASTGASIREVELHLGSIVSKVRLVAMLDTLEYVHRSGRVPKVAVWATNALNIKPVMEYSTGKIGAIARPRSVNRAIKRIQSEMSRDLCDSVAHVNVVHAGAPERAELLRNWAENNLNCDEVLVTQFHPFMGAHTGPGLVGASWWAE